MFIVTEYAALICHLHPMTSSFQMPHCILNVPFFRWPVYLLCELPKKSASSYKYKTVLHYIGTVMKLTSQQVSCHRKIGPDRFRYHRNAKLMHIRLLVTFANSLDPDQARQNVGPGLDPNCLALWSHSWNSFLKKVILKNSAYDKITMQRANSACTHIPYYREILYLHTLKVPVYGSTNRNTIICTTWPGPPCLHAR